jgi:hypothetical protein
MDQCSGRSEIPDSDERMERIRQTVTEEETEKTRMALG